MDIKFLNEWGMISTAVRAAISDGNYGWVSGFGKAYFAATGDELTCETLRGKMPFAIEPIAPPKGNDIHMLIFFENGHIYEGKLLNDTGRILLMWVNSTDYKNRPLLTTVGRIRVPTAAKPAKMARTEQSTQQLSVDEADVSSKDV